MTFLVNTVNMTPCEGSIIQERIWITVLLKKQIPLIKLHYLKKCIISI